MERSVSLGQIAKMWGRDQSFKATLSRVERGLWVSKKNEDFIRSRLELPPLPEPITLYRCPTCGGYHDIPDCNGDLSIKLFDVIAVQPDKRSPKRTARRNAPKRRRFRPDIKEDVKRRLDEERRDGETYNDVIARLIGVR